MQPQRNPAPPKAKWQAYQERPRNWQVGEYKPGHSLPERIIASGLTEDMAKQMVADHGKAALCEELADALADLLREITEMVDWLVQRTGATIPESDRFEDQPVVRRSRAILTKAGRTPG